MKLVPAVVPICLVLLALPAFADVLFLDGGGQVEGVVTEGPSSFTIKSIRGTAVVPLAKVVRRLKIPYVTEIYADRRERVDPEDPEAQFRLSEWCERKGLKREAREHLDRVLALEPDHTRARAKRGQVRFKGIWMSPAEKKEVEMAAAGFIRFEGRWFTETGLKAYMNARKELLVLEEIAARKKAEREAAEREALAAEERLKLEEAERKAIVAAVDRAEESRRERERLARENDELRDLLRDLSRRNRLWDFGYYQVVYPYYVVPGITGGTSRLGGHRLFDHGTSLRFRYSRGNFQLRGRVR